MLITRETDYALRILRCLQDGRLRSIPKICQEEQVPKQFAYKILKKLSANGLVEITRGTAGGCRLAADPKEVTLYRVMCATEEDRLVNACTDCGYDCERAGTMDEGCTIHCCLCRVQERLDALLKEYTLDDLLCKQN